MENKSYVPDDYPIQKPNFIIHKVIFFIRFIFEPNFGPSPFHWTILVQISVHAGPFLGLIRS